MQGERWVNLWNGGRIIAEAFANVYSSDILGSTEVPVLLQVYQSPWPPLLSIDFLGLCPTTSFPSGKGLCSSTSKYLLMAKLDLPGDTSKLRKCLYGLAWASGEPLLLLLCTLQLRLNSFSSCLSARREGAGSGALWYWKSWVMWPETLIWDLTVLEACILPVSWVQSHLPALLCILLLPTPYGSFLEQGPSLILQRWHQSERRTGLS